MKNWKMREIVVMSVISVVFAVIYLVSTHASNIAAGFFGRMSYEPIYGIWFIVSVIAAYIIQNRERLSFLKSSPRLWSAYSEIRQDRW